MATPSIFARSVHIAAPVEKVFAFHLDTRNAPAISADGATFLAIDGEFPVREGGVVELRVRQAPIPLAQTWRVRIGPIVENALVVDTAERSPFAEWRHEHRFAPTPSGGTLMTDHIVYRLPLGIVGRLADRLVAQRQLEAMFAERHAKTRALLEEAP